MGLLEREPGCLPSLLDRIRDLKLATQDVMDELHALTVALRPTSLDRLGLAAALKQYVEHFRRQSRLDVTLEIAGIEGVRLTPGTEIALYRIGQEALTNVARHASAHYVGLMVTRTGDRVTVVIEDDGVGFEPTKARSGRLGLVGMQERVQMVGGTFAVESAPGRGTTVLPQVSFGLRAAATPA